MTASKLSGTPGFVRDLARLMPWATATLSDLALVIEKLKTLPKAVAALVIVLVALTSLTRFALFLVIGLVLCSGWALERLLESKPKTVGVGAGGGAGGAT